MSHRLEDSLLYKETYEEAQRIIRISEEIRMKVTKQESEALEHDVKPEQNIEVENTLNNFIPSNKKISSTKLAEKHGVTKSKLDKFLEHNGYIFKIDNKQVITEKAASIGAELKNGQYGQYIIWPENLPFS